MLVRGTGTPPAWVVVAMVFPLTIELVNVNDVPAELATLSVLISDAARLPPMNTSN
jgi:hypothetical protein